ASTMALFFYYTPFIVVFQFGWASTQISHLALIPELTSDEHEKTSLNAIRYGATVGSNIFVFSIVWVFLHSMVTGDHSVSPKDSPAFMYVVFVILGTGLLFMVIFHVGVKEPYRTCSHELASSGNMRSSQSWKLWFKKIQFYQLTFFIGCIFCIGACASFRFLSYRQTHVQQFMYGASVALGIGGSIMLITALTIISEMIGNNKETGAFVYGAMSFVDKLSNGIAVQIIQVFHPCSNSVVCCGDCGPFYKDVMTYVAGGAAVLALLSLVTMWKTQIGKFDRKGTTMQTSAQKQLLECDPSLSTTISGSQARNVPSPNGPTIPYDPKGQSKYGSIECRSPVLNVSIQTETCNLKQCDNVENPYDPKGQSKYGSIECRNPVLNGSIPTETCNLKQCGKSI
ncbi:hypothetical protein QZH41_020039, partial [Actinostola sp. cb2023]